MSKPNAAQSLSRDEVAFLETTLKGLPTTKSSGVGTGEADGLLKFKYHQNPYLRVYANVLWSGYAVARGQIAEGNQRFAAARRDGQVSAVDAVTAKAMDDAHQALENAMAPDGTIAGFLATLRERTVQRLWARVCETTGLPPPRFHVLLGKGAGQTQQEIDAAEEAELAALRKNVAPPVIPEPAEDDDGGDDDMEGDDEGDDEGAGEPSAPAALQVTATQRCGSEVAAESLLTAAAEALRQWRVKGGAGPVTITVTFDGQGTAANRQDGGRRRRRRRR